MSASRRLKRSVARGTTVAGAVAGIAGLTLTGPVGAAAATESGSPQVVNRETVQAQLDPSGELESARLYSQLTVLGKGKVDIADPTSGKDVRDLDGFSAPMVRDGKAQYSITVDGREDRRTVADYTGEMPVTLKAEYTLDGERIDPEDVVGRSGKLEATYTVVNRTAEPTEITYKDYAGNDVKETVDLVTPYVGSLKVLLPSSYSGITADRADVAGDGRGANGVSWSLVLFNPLGEPAQQLTWSAEVEDAVLPPANLQVVPVVPGGNAVLPNGLTQIGDGATAATALTSGAYRIDGKVLELRDGLGKILDGLTQLADGSQALNTGLADTAAPGAQTLSDGLGSAREGGATLGEGLGKLAAGGKTLGNGLNTASAGGDKLADGLDQLVSGGGRLIAGLNSAADGGGRLAEGLRSTSGEPDLAGGTKSVADGLATVSGGISTLSAGLKALPQNPGIAQLKGALAQVQAGIGQYTDVATATTPNPTLLGATNALKFGMRNPAKVSAFACSTDPGLPNSCGVADVNERIAGLLGQAAASSNAGLDGLIAGAKATYTAANCATPAQVGNPPVPIAGFLPGSVLRTLPLVPFGDQAVCAGIADLLYGLALPANVPGTGQPAGGVLAQTQSSKAQLGEAAAGLTKTYQAIDTTVIPTLDKIQGGLSNPGWDLNGNGAVDTGEKPGVKEVQAIVSGGIDLLVKGIVDGLSAGVDGSLAPGVNLLAAGSKTLAEKTALAADGAATLRGGLNELAAGGGTLAAGAGAAATGARTLSGGLDQLAAGGGTLVAGLDAANAGGVKLVDGLGKLDDGGAKLAAGLQDAADGSGKLADGIGQVKAGVQTAGDGANRLSGEGTSLLAGSANTAAKGASKNAAMLAAMRDKAADGALPYGLPEDASGTAAFSVVLAGANSDAEDSTTRGAAALALLTLGSLSGFVLRRRFVS